jgi:hypothetical protein
MLRATGDKTTGAANHHDPVTEHIRHARDVASGEAAPLTLPSTHPHADQKGARAMLNLTMIPTTAGFVGVTSVRHGF